jgi:hypothetical protein
MPIVADYVIVSDAPVDLSGSSSHEFTFSIPPDALLSQKAILTFQLQTEGTPVNLDWNIHLNGGKIFHAIHKHRDFCAVQEVFSGSVLKKGSNTLIAALNALTTETLKISDIVVWFQHAA